MVDESGAFEIYLRPYSELDRRWPVSDRGGFWPVWNRSGDRIFYYTEQDGRLVELSVEPGENGACASALRPYLVAPC